MIPRTYDEWLRCITRDCGITLTRGFVQQRIQRLRDERDQDTMRFIRLYGGAHRSAVVGWFEHVLGTLP